MDPYVTSQIAESHRESAESVWECTPFTLETAHRLTNIFFFLPVLGFLDRYQSTIAKSLKFPGPQLYFTQHEFIEQHSNDCLDDAHCPPSLDI